MGMRRFFFLELFEKRSHAERLSLILHIAILGTFCLMSMVLSAWLDLQLKERSFAELNRVNQMAVEMIDTFVTQLETSAERMEVAFSQTLPRINTERLNVEVFQSKVKNYVNSNGVLAAVFLKQSSQLVSVATSADSKGAVNFSTLSAVSPMAQSLLMGEPFEGVSNLLGKEYMLNCQPFRSTTGSLLGASCVGVDFSVGLDAIKRKLRDIKFGKTGYLFVQDIRNDNGRFLLHPHLEDVNVLDSPIESVRDAGKKLDSIESGIIRFDWKNSESGPLVKMVAAIRVYEKLGWRIGAIISESEIFQDSRDLRINLFAFGLLMTLVLSGVVFLTIRRFRLSETELLSSEQRLRNLFELSPVGIVLTDQKGNYIDFNEAYRVMTGYSRVDLLSRKYQSITLNQDDELDKQRIKSLIETGRYGPLEKEYRTQDGRVVRIKASGAIVHSPGHDDYVWSIVEDITERYKAELDLRLAASAFVNIQEGVAIFDREGIFLDINEAYSRITGYSKDELKGKRPNILKSGHHSSAFFRALWESLLLDGSWRGELWNRRKNGSLFPCQQTISAIRDMNGNVTHFVAAINDVSERRENELRLQRMAHYDPLTGLPNRALLNDRLQQAISHATYTGSLLAICYLDLDSFKPINDQYGHEVGDRVLSEVANRLTELVHGGDTVARLGGDEFVLLFNDIEDQNECLSLIRKLLQIIPSPIYIDSSRLSVTVSVGITLYPNDNEAPDILIRHADQAMYIAKEFGKNTFHIFDPSQDKRNQSNRQSTRRIELALSADEFILLYQPKVDMRRGKVIGAEALIRWQHPERGLLSPIEFLPLIEGTELMVCVGDWVIQEALRQMYLWQEQGLQLKVSVNTAAIQLQQADFVEKLRGWLALYPMLSPGMLELEILESAALDDISHISRVMAECQDIGICFALDDFGTGYSSLTYFKRLPASTLKIDQSFVRDMIADPEDLAIVEAVIGLTDVFRRNVIAEGVESIEHGIMLLHLGCDFAQGYCISKPLPAAQFPSWVAEWQPDKSWSVAAGARWKRDDFPLVLAEVDHRRWVEKAVAYANGTSNTMPELHPNRCHFWSWFSHDGAERYGHHSGYELVRDFHDRLHVVGAAACNARHQQESPELLLIELLVLRDGLSSLLHNLVTTSAQNGFYSEVPRKMRGFQFP